MNSTKTDYVPALAYDRLTPFYDAVMRYTMREKTFKIRLIEQAGIQPGHRVLDLGCGTATLTLMVKAAHPDAEVVGLTVIRKRSLWRKPRPHSKAWPFNSIKACQRNSLMRIAASTASLQACSFII